MPLVIQVVRNEVWGVTDTILSKAGSGRHRIPCQSLKYHFEYDRLYELPLSIIQDIPDFSEEDYNILYNWCCNRWPEFSNRIDWIREEMTREAFQNLAVFIEIDQDDDEGIPISVREDIDPEKGYRECDCEDLRRMILTAPLRVREPITFICSMPTSMFVEIAYRSGFIAYRRLSAFEWRLFYEHYIWDMECPMSGNRVNWIKEGF